MTLWGPKDLLGGTACWAVVDDLTLLVIPHDQMSNEEWYKALSEAYGHAQRLGISPKSSIAYYGWPVSASQRKIAMEFTKGKSEQGRHALLTDSALVRGALTALSWIAPSLRARAFSLDQLEQASAWVGEHHPHDSAEVVRQLRAAFHRYRLRP